MTTIHPNLPSTASLTPASASLPAANLANHIEDSASKRSSGEKVTLSGHAQLLSRLYQTDEANYNTTTKSGPPGKQGRVADFLTKDDRNMLEKLYEYSSANNIDLAHVDALAMDLGAYRMQGSQARNVNDAKLYDGQGHKLSFDFNASDKQIAQRIAGSAAAQQTTLDQGFLQSELTPATHAVNFAFLEKVVEVFSPAAKNNPQGKLAAYSSSQNQLQVSKSSTVEITIPEADFRNENGVKSYRTPELAAANGSSASAKSYLKKSDHALLALLDGTAKAHQLDTRQMDHLTTLLATHRQRIAGL